MTLSFLKEVFNQTPAHITNTVIMS